MCIAPSRPAGPSNEWSAGNVDNQASILSSSDLPADHQGDGPANHCGLTSIIRRVAHLSTALVSSTLDRNLSTQERMLCPNMTVAEVLALHAGPTSVGAFLQLILE